MVNNTIESKIICLSRIPLACLVVLIHTNVGIDGWSYNAQMWHSPSCADIFRIFNLGLCKILPAFTVPLFFLISGYLFFRGLVSWNTKCWWQKIKRRVTTLVVPYVVWVTLYILYLIILQYYNDESVSQWYADQGGILNIYWDNVVLVPMWYVRDLIVATVLTPILYLLLKMRENMFNRVLSPLTLIIFFVLYELSYCGYSVYKSEAILFFSIGSWIAVNKIDYVEICKKLFVPSIVLFPLLFVLEVIYGGDTTFHGGILMPFYIMVSIVLFIELLARIIESQRNNRVVNICCNLSFCSFFLYAFHTFILKDIVLLLFNLLLGTSSTNIPIDIVNEHFGLCIICLLIATILTIITSIVLCKVLKSVFPKSFITILGIR